MSQIPKQANYEKYFVSRNGRVFNTITKKELSQHNSGKGYMRVCISIKNKERIVSVHRLVAIAYVPNPSNYPQVNHINGVKSDNRAENLEWCTGQQNQIHAVNTGLKKSGSSVYNAKLKGEDFGKIKKLKSEGLSQNKIAKIIGISSQCMSDFFSGKTYKNQAR